MAITSRPLDTARDDFTVDDVLAAPDDGLRYELLDGMLIVNPPPRYAHQKALVSLIVLISSGRIEGLDVVAAPFGWRVSEQRWFEPDVMVVARSSTDPDRNHVVDPPHLVVEVLSPSTRVIDQTAKFRAYDEAGVGAFWIVDPKVDGPSIDVFERVAASAPLELVARAVGGERLDLTTPWPVTVVPADLLR